MDFDRTSFVPPHEGDTVLPLSPFFTRLLLHAQRKPPRSAIRDVHLGVEKDYLQFITDVLAFRKCLRASLNQETLDALRRREEVYVALIAAGGYEYAVGFVAIAALGAAVVPIAVTLPVHEATYFVVKASCVAILASSAAFPLGQSIASHLSKSHHKHLPCLRIADNFQSTSLPAEEITISSDRYLSDNGAALIIFTSGTTGRPKGAVMRRGYLHDGCEPLINHFRITETDVSLHVLPVHHATGIGITFLPFIYAGACVEFRSGSVDIAWLWERWRKGGVSIFSGVPTIYMRMMRHFEKKLSSLPATQVQEYIAGARGIRALLCGTSALPTPLAQFWSKILGGKRKIITRYGATEIGPVFTAALGREEELPEGSVGPVFPGVTVKLADGDEGEILVKSPYMFAKYLFDPDATQSAHDAHGYFRTGDIARRERDPVTGVMNYFILGRASIDIIKSGGYKLSALDIEREILGLPYVAEAMVVGVPDEEFGQRVGAVIVLRDDQNIYSTDPNPNAVVTNPAGADKKRRKFTIYDLRNDLRSKLAGYKLPTLLRVVSGELPKSGTGKIVKKVLGPQYFPDGYERDELVQVWRRESKI
ncbi:hypothetical protein VTO42DRAFT_4120 [Malbranchea cinnamomea]